MKNGSKLPSDGSADDNAPSSLAPYLRDSRVCGGLTFPQRREQYQRQKKPTSAEELIRSLEPAHGNRGAEELDSDWDEEAHLPDEAVLELPRAQKSIADGNGVALWVTRRRPAANEGARKRKVGKEEEGKSGAAERAKAFEDKTAAGRAAARGSAAPLLQSPPRADAERAERAGWEVALAEQVRLGVESPRLRGALLRYAEMRQKELARETKAAPKQSDKQ